MKFKILFLLLGVLTLLSSAASPEVPKLLNYQGKITRPSGTLIDTTVSIVFSIYSDSTGGTTLWTETQTSVKVEYGVFSVLLGVANPIPDSVFSGNIRYLGLKVGNDQEMAPRRAIVSVGYAYDADMVDGKNSSDFVQTTGDQTIGGVKTFENIPVLPASDPTTDNQASRKKYVDDKVATVSAQAGFGAWESKSNNTVYQAATDGFVCATALADTRTDVIGLTDGSNPPTTRRAVDGDIPNNEGDKRRPRSITFPVRKNDYWKVTGADAVYWIPLGS